MARAVPVTGSKDDRDYPRIAIFVAYYRLLHFNIVAIVGTEKIGTDKKQDDVCRLKLGGNLLVNFLSGQHATNMPNTDHALVAKCRQVLFELIAQVLVGMRVRYEESGHRCVLTNLQEFAEMSPE